MAKDLLPTLAQAKRLAALFGEHKQAKISERHSSVTDLTLVKRGWVSPTGVTAKFPNGSEYALFEINSLGFLALERFLFSQRMKEAAA